MMKLLLDTCTFLWIVQGSSELSNTTKALFSDPENEVYLSTVSLWEIMIKCQLGRLPLPNPAEQFVVGQRKLHRIESLALQEEAVMQLTRLPDHHKDPFDRILVCQAIAHSLTVLIPDKNISQYPIISIW